ncbi:MAG: hypothetical protein Q8M94_21875 [Ignavibacteria bacterium]|nr:hypothetical protein [Ignavibacteria bacterium]
MNYRNTVLLATEAMAASGTKIIDLTLSDVISRLSLDIYAVNSAAVPTAHPAKIISKIELVDGSDVLWGLSGPEALALMFYQNKRTPIVLNNYISGEWARCIMDINFGRILYDKQLAFDPKKFKNPQLKISYTLLNGGAAPGSGGFKVMADVFDQKEVAPVGFLSAKEIISYTPASGANEYIDIPTDRTLKSLIVFARKLKTFPIVDVSSVKLSEDNDKRIIVEDSMSQIQKLFHGQYPDLTEHFQKSGSAAAERLYCMTSYIGCIAAMNREAAVNVFTATTPSSGFTDISGGTGASIHGIINGYAPFGSLILPLGDPADIDDWYDVSKVGKLEMRIKAGTGVTADSTCEVVTEQLREYAAMA